MLRIGLTGGIGAGKSTVAATFTECGGIVVDGDVIAREVVEPGTEGLAALVDAFGTNILLPDGALNRPALAAVAFSDDAQRATLNGIVHPLVARRRAELIAGVADAAEKPAVVVEDIPLLVESQMAPLFPLLIVVHAEVETRVKRLVESRGMPEADARARIAAQAVEEQRRAVADVWLDNSGAPGVLVERARELWHQRILPFAENIAARRTVPSPLRLVPADPTWGAQAGRIIARIQLACGHRAVRVDHIGPTAVRGPEAPEAPDVIDIQVTVESLAAADEFADQLLGAGYPRVEEITGDLAEPGARSTAAGFDRTDRSTWWEKRFHASADPGRPTNVHIRVDGRPNQQFALLLVDWLAANPGARLARLAVHEGYQRAWAWADSTGWRPS